MIETIGYIAAILTTFAFVPQVLQIYRTKSAKDVSLAMFLIFTLGVFLWLCYGVVIRSFPMIAANAVTFILALTILYFKFKYSRTTN
ncbi:MAG: SemiSWEET transporter [Spirosomataceae bacterium]